jgi:hypothetical protein
MNEVIEYKSSFKLISKLQDKKYSIQFLPDCLLNLSSNKKFIHRQRNLKTSYVIDLVHNLILKYYFKKDNIFNLSSIVLKEKYGHLYNYYVDYLVDSNLLILIKKHNKGKNARIYKLSDKVINGDVTRYKNSDQILLKKYKKSICSISEFDVEINPIEQSVKTKLIEDLFCVDIDYVKSIFFLDSSKQDQDIYQKNKYSVESIRDKHIFYHFDNYGRLHTNFTILKSFIRKNCLLIDGEETFEMDIKNSQPLFLNQILDDSIIFEEKIFYRELTMNGNFYQFLQEKYSIKDKKTVKDLTYKVLFGKNYPNKYDKIFAEVFPTIYQFIKSYKKQKGDYRSLSYELQRNESNFLFNKVVLTLKNYFPEIKLISCHDSLICKISDRHRVSEIFNQLLNEEFNQST